MSWLEAISNVLAESDAPLHYSEISEKILSEVEIDNSDSIIQSFGMYWQREPVLWKNDPKMYGRQQALAKSVDFGHQKGIYILYDHHTVVYVGRSIDRPSVRQTPL